ncbi:MAG: HAMP domain-containing sensor histidine kinase [Solirubrobacteraceae bacterium]
MTALWRRASLRTRLLGSVAVGTVLALGGLVLAFNLVLASRLDADANSLARAQAAAQVSALRVNGGRVRLPDAPDGRNPDSEIWVFQADSALERPRTSTANDRAAAQLALRTPAFSDVDSTETRLYAAPVALTRPAAVVVVGVSLGAYEETRHTALIASVILAACIGLLVLVAARWLIGRALEPVATMTRQASQWSEHDLDRRFSPGEAQDEIAQLATTLNGLLERIGASLRHEQRLSAEISHELRTPLASVIAEAQFAQRHGVEDETLTRILERSQELRRTLDALMAAARAEFSPRLARADAVACAQTAVAHAAVVRPELSASVDEPTGEPVLVGVEADLVQQILAPLLENAVRHAATTVTVSVQREDDAVVLSVQDDGRGVPADERDAIFAPGPGKRGPAIAGAPARGTAVASSGAGLGLALCRRLATSAGGEVRLEPAETGARFTVRLPGP